MPSCVGSLPGALHPLARWVPPPPERLHSALTPTPPQLHPPQKWGSSGQHSANMGPAPASSPVFQMFARLTFESLLRPALARLQEHAELSPAPGPLHSKFPLPVTLPALVVAPPHHFTPARMLPLWGAALTAPPAVAGSRLTLTQARLRRREEWGYRSVHPAGTSRSSCHVPGCPRTMTVIILCTVPSLPRGHHDPAPLDCVPGSVWPTAVFAAQ